MPASIFTPRSQGFAATTDSSSRICARCRPTWQSSQHWVGCLELCCAALPSAFSAAPQWLLDTNSRSFSYCRGWRGAASSCIARPCFCATSIDHYQRNVE
jgi:hypothetical protein